MWSGLFATVIKSYGWTIAVRGRSFSEWSVNIMKSKMTFIVQPFTVIIKVVIQTTTVGEYTVYAKDQFCYYLIIP